ncbi:signal peptide peptidase SppA [Methylobacter tundripaludum]|uniref:Signal peptide peptidase SppA, 36K type n=1 Tax=Methylobacter tundripaludum (strain ATCC BAA-1195 / DSM 17260 / SV96) TaxID=697282 RepID=G3J0H5_METTV|nr:signal peptide peptidase SppA [Methylobacter tundripaludum]EGW20697.1 signal peptide peptidase SppA, 36K type [Methylobacter tundripaludum SV96]
MDNQNKPEVTRESGWEREVIEKLALAAITEQTRARRWGVFFKSLMFVYLIAVFGVAMYPKLKQDIGVDSKDHTAVIDVVGMIAEGKEANADSIIESLRNAVKDKHTKGIILHANSPGGSPVQSSYVYEEIRKIKKEHPELPIYAVVSDICASGCYFIVSASDKIFVNPSSLVGSIGVLMDGFGFVDGMQKLGVERRLFTAGAHKAMLDPFSPSKEDETQYIQSLLNQVHQQFIGAVKAGRGDRLKENPDMFSGLVWTGEEGVKLGIVDGVGNQDYVAKELIGAETQVDFSRQEHLLDKIAGKLGASFGQVIGSLVQGASLR